MKSCHLTISSKNLRSINKLLSFFQNSIEPNFNVLKKYFQQKRKRKILTILKSPHVNKAAQEQFEYRIFSKQLVVYSTQYSKYLILLKKLQANLFPDIKIKVKFVINSKGVAKLKTKIFNPDNFKGNFYKNLIHQNSKSQNLKKDEINQTSLLEKTKKILKIMDVYGEMLRKT